MQLEIESITPRPELAVELDQQLQTPIEVSFLSRVCINKPMGSSTQYDITESQFQNPRYLFLVTHGTTGDANQNLPTANYQLYRHSNINNLTVTIDGEQFPNLSQNAFFLENQFSSFYQEFINCCKSLRFDTDQSVMSAQQFRDLFTIFSVNLKNKKEKLSNQVVNMNVRVVRNAVPANNNTLVNPRDIELFEIALTGKKIKIDCIKNIVTEIY
jgi:hypothetical protein